jgi:hypothetical protein
MMAVAIPQVKDIATRNYSQRTTRAVNGLAPLAESCWDLVNVFVSESLDQCTGIMQRPDCLCMPSFRQAKVVLSGFELHVGIFLMFVTRHHVAIVL